MDDVVDGDFEQLQRQAEELVRRVKDVAFDDAVVLVMKTMLEMRRVLQTELLDEVGQRLRDVTSASASE